MDMKLFSGLVIAFIFTDTFQPSVSMLGIRRKNKHKSPATIRDEAPSVVVRFTTGPGDPCICSGAFAGDYTGAYVLTTRTCADRIKRINGVNAVTARREYPVVNGMKGIGGQLVLVPVKEHPGYSFTVQRPDESYEREATSSAPHPISEFADEAKWEQDTTTNQWKAFRKQALSISTVEDNLANMLIPSTDEGFSDCDSGAPLFFTVEAIKGYTSYLLAGLRKDSENYVNVAKSGNEILGMVKKA